MTRQSARSSVPTDGLRREIWLAARIAERTVGRFECQIFVGLTDERTRAQRARELIVRFQLSGQRVYLSKPETFGELFERYYGEPVAPAEVAA